MSFSQSKENNADEELKNKQKICDYLDKFSTKDMNKVEQKIFRGIIEKKISDNDAFTDSEEVEHNEDQSLNIDQIINISSNADRRLTDVGLFHGKHSPLHSLIKDKNSTVFHSNFAPIKISLENLLQ